jgi:site-specific recombinase XerD
MAQRKKDALPKTKTAEEWAAFFRCIATRYPTAARNHALLYLTYLTGMRIGEALLLEVRDVDLDRFKVRVRQGKTGERVVPLADDSRLHTSLERWIRVREEWSPTSDLLFVTRSGECLSAAAVRRSMELYGQRSGIGHVTPHMLRHSAATEMLANGAPPIGVQRVLGHRSLRTTLETYAHACDTHAAEAMVHRFGR